MSTDILDFDPYKRNAYSKDVSFDIGHKDMSATTSSVFTEDEYNPLVSEKKTQSKEWELDVRSLISSKKWLQNYGLKKNKLSLFQILPTIGFKVADDFDFSLKRPVSSRYGTGLFSQVFRSSDGKTFNVTCSRQQLRQLEGRLLQAIALYKRRLEWLTTESRRVFGVIEEKALTIVLDIRNMSPQQFDQYKIALEQVIFEQLTQVAKFNIIRATDDIQSYHEECIPVTYDTIQGAVDWLWSLDRLASVSRSAAVESVIRAIGDKNNEAVYLFTEGTAIDSCKEIMKEKVLALKRKIPVHCVSYNCDSSDTVRFLRDFAASTGGKFHAYAVIMEMDSYEGQPLDPRTNRANIVLKKKTYGGIPPGAGMRDDVIDIFQEMEEARNTVAQLQALMEQVPEPKIQIESQIEKKVVEDTGEQYMGSREWLKRFGLTSRRLELFDVLAGVAFKHKDGVVDMKYRPEANTQTDAVSRPKLLNAKYCDRFPVVRWKDGGVVHVQVTPELHRSYEQRMSIAVQAFNQRIDWLNQGSRALFGTVIEDQIYILIDTSSSMTPSIQFVKDKLFVLMQEQLRHKMKFNLIAFNSKATPWQNRMVEVGEQSLKGAWKWIQGLTCWGSTNTYAALQHALSDPGTQAVYLLTDGRPDQPPRSIIAQVQMQHCVPVHSISFNCNDTEANQFLCDLARATGGRYHYYSEKGKLDQDQPQSWESEDIRLLKEEINRGLESLDKIEELRDECSNLSWKKEVEDLKRCSRNHPIPETDRVSSMPVMKPADLYRSETPPLRPKSAPPDSPRMTPVPPSRPKTSRGRLSISSDMGRPGTGRPFSASKQDKNPLSANKSRYGKIRLGYTKTGHTRTSLLRTLNSSGHFSTDEWLLPETRQLFEKQAQRQKQLAIEERQKQYRITATKHKKGYRPKEMSSKMWLGKHGLIAKKLTILDALAPTFVPHKAKYVPILDKHVLAKVFDEVLPLAHVSGRSRKRITLVNPNAVDLKSYEEKVDRAVAKYEERLDKIVWQALPKSAQEQFESDEPISFRNNRLTLTKALETAGWPIKENDILLLEKEICRGEKFIQQSRELRKASDSNKRYSDGDLVKSRSDDSLASSDRGRRRSRSRESLSSDSSKSSRSSRSSKSSARRSHDSLNLDDQRKDVNINDDLNVYDDKASVVSSLSINSNPTEVSRT